MGWLMYNGVFVEKGYFGYREGKDNLDMECIVNVGLIFRGIYYIGSFRGSSESGFYVLDLLSYGYNVYGCIEFLIYGDSMNNFGNVLKGCIILLRKTREKIFLMSDDVLEVVWWKE